MGKERAATMVVRALMLFVFSAGAVVGYHSDNQALEAASSIGILWWIVWSMRIR